MTSSLLFKDVFLFDSSRPDFFHYNISVKFTNTFFYETAYGLKISCMTLTLVINYHKFHVDLKISISGFNTGRLMAEVLLAKLEVAGCNPNFSISVVSILTEKKEKILSMQNFFV